MGDYINSNQQDYYWSQQNPPNNQGYYEQDYTQFQNQTLEFNTNIEYNDQAFSNTPQMLIPEQYDNIGKGEDEFDEPPLLEELEIYPDRILEKILAVLNPLRGHSLADDAEYLTKDSDVVGPILFCLLLAANLFLAGKSGYIYGISMISCILMYALLSLMSPDNGTFSLSIVGSILGYCLIPIVALSSLGIFFRLNGPTGLFLAILTIAWSSLSASRLFIAVSGDKEQQPLIAYPCMLVYGVITLLVLF
ncbi:protein YIPF7 [Diabrotica virgifera virgifera]|uniref:Protein YIPF7 n=1 Tax=Diabrotica virgifera virgifera TaxID=50390 RepID=A0A6P7F8F7_DIAVI|nr:protein YIPF7 [Diabrotica virgifera virgifera]